MTEKTVLLQFYEEKEFNNFISKYVKPKLGSIINYVNINDEQLTKIIDGEDG